MNTTLEFNQTKRLLVIALTAAMCSASPGFARQAAPEAEAAATAEAQETAKRKQEMAAQAAERASEKYRVAQQANAIRSKRFAESLEAAETEQRAALEAVEAARAELMRQAEIKAERSRQDSEVQRDIAEQQRLESLEMREIQRELERAHANLRRASQEVAQVHRNLHRVDHALAPTARIGGSQAVIGVVLGENTPQGVRIVAVSPDGPAERAGMEPGDLIVSLMGEPLSAGGVDGRNVLSDVMNTIEPGDELIIGYERGDVLIEETLTAEERVPFSWEIVTRLASPPSPPGGPEAPQLPPTAPGDPQPPPAGPGAPKPPPAPPISIQTIDGQSIRVTELTQDIRRLQEELDEQGLFMGDIESEGDVHTIISHRSSSSDPLSEPGLAALAATGLWFGVPLTRGIKFTELDAELGAYFKVNKGVLVMSARPDNELQLRSGDVIMSIAGRDVLRPGDVMRALRTVNAGDLITLRIMREGEEQDFDLEIPQNSIGMLMSNDFSVDQIGAWDLQIEIPQPDDN